MSNLTAISNVIELKKDKKYLFVFSRESGLRVRQVGELLKSLNDQGFQGIAVIVKDVKDLTIVEQ